MASACTRGGETGAGALDDQRALELGEAGEDREHEAAVGGGGLDRCTFARQHLQSDAALRQITDPVDEVAQIASEPSQLPNDQRIVVTERLAADLQVGARVASARGGVLIDMIGIDPGRDQRAALEVVNLATVGL